MGLFSSIGKFLFGKKPRREQVSRYHPQQEQALSKLLSQGMANIDPQAMEDRYTKMFQEQTIPGIAQQFTTSGGQGSGAFQSALGRAGGDLASQLAALRSKRGMQQTQMGLTQQFDTEVIPGTPGYLQNNLAKAEQFLFALATGGGKLQGTGLGNQSQGGSGGPLYYGGQPKGYKGGRQAASNLKMTLGMY